MVEVEKRPIGSWGSFFKGILGGSLISSGIFSEFGSGIQIIIFIIGLLIVIDTIISKTEEIYPMSMFFGAVAGFFIALFCVIGKITLHYTALIFIFAVLVYIGRLITKFRRA